MIDEPDKHFVFRVRIGTDLAPAEEYTPPICGAALDVYALTTHEEHATCEACRQRMRETLFGALGPVEKRTLFPISDTESGDPPKGSRLWRCEAELRKARERMTDAEREAEQARAVIRELERNALPSNCTHCNGSGVEPPGCPESDRCEWCGGWTEHKRAVATDRASRENGIKSVLDEVLSPSTYPIGAPDSLMRRAWELGRERLDAVRRVESAERERDAQRSAADDAENAMREANVRNVGLLEEIATLRAERDGAIRARIDAEERLGELRHRLEAEARRLVPTDPRATLTIDAVISAVLPNVAHALPTADRGEASEYEETCGRCGAEVFGGKCQRDGCTGRTIVAKPAKVQRANHKSGGDAFMCLYGGARDDGRTHCEGCGAEYDDAPAKPEPAAPVSAPAFEVGQWVCLDPEFAMPSDTPAKITHAEGDGVVAIDLDGDERVWSRRLIKPWEPRVGERVQVGATKHVHGTVDGINAATLPTSVRVREDNGLTRWWDLDEIEPLAEPAAPARECPIGPGPLAALRAGTAVEQLAAYLLDELVDVKARVEAGDLETRLRDIDSVIAQHGEEIEALLKKDGDRG